MFQLSDGRIISGKGYTEIDGVQYPLSRMTPQERAAIGVIDYVPPAPTILTHPEFYFVSDIGDPVPRPIEDIRAVLKARVAAERYELEIGGTLWGEQLIWTDRETRSSYLATIMALQLGMRTDGAIWKFPDGPKPLANADVIPMATAALTFVQALFDREAQIGEAIDALVDVTAAEAFTWSWDEI